MKPNISDIPTVIIAGGQGTRMEGISAKGTDKCLLTIGPQSILSHIIDRLSGQSDTVYLNANGDARRFREYNLPFVADQILPSIGPLGGLQSAMAQLSMEGRSYTHILTIAGDCPFIPRNLLATLATSFMEKNDVVFCHSNGSDHFLNALWSLDTLDRLVAFVNGGGRSVGSFISTLNHNKVCFNFQNVDPFFNINTKEHLQKARKLFMSHI